MAYYRGRGGVAVRGHDAFAGMRFTKDSFSGVKVGVTQESG